MAPDRVTMLATARPAGLSYRGVTKRFGAVTAVDNVSFDVPEGQMLGIIGRSGAGKSTLLRLTNRLADPTSGAMTIDDIDVGALKGKALLRWRAECAMIFQQFNLVPRLDVLTNVLLGRLNHRSTVLNLLNIIHNVFFVRGLGWGIASVA